MIYPSKEEVELEAKRSMRRVFTAVGFVFICVGLFGVVWPFPFFTLNEPYLSWYGELLFGPSFSAPGGAGAAAPFLWLVTAPLGLILAGLGVPLICLGQRKPCAPKESGNE